MSILGRLFNSTTPAGQETLMLLVNLEEKYADPVRGTGSAQTKEAAKRIKKMVGDFRKLGVTVCATYVENDPMKPHAPRFCEYKPDNDDILLCSTQKTAIVLDDPVLTEKIKSANIKKILVCGTSFNVAVNAYALVAKEKGFDVQILSDMTGNDSTLESSSIPTRGILDGLKKNGVTVHSAMSAIQQLKK